jgi:hypothetical protein
MGVHEGRPAPAGLAVAERVLLGKRLRDAYGACATCSQMARLSTYAIVGGFDPTLARSSDTDLNVRLARIGAHFVGIARPLVLQKMTKTSEKSLAEEHRHMVALYKKHREFVDRAGGYEFCIAWLEVKHAWLEGWLARFVWRVTRIALSHPLLTLNRIMLAIPNFGLNRTFSRFHLRGGE